MVHSRRKEGQGKVGFDPSLGLSKANDGKEQSKHRLSTMKIYASHHEDIGYVQCGYRLPTM